MEDPFAQISAPSLSLISDKQVGNTWPTVDVDYRLAIIGEAPGEDEVAFGRPFVGASGDFLNQILQGSNIMRSACYIGNVCKFQPPGNKLMVWGVTHPKVLAGWAELQADLQTFRPNCILGLGNVPLHFLYNQWGISEWRGSILQTRFGKLVPAFHPAYILRSYKEWVLLRHDAIRARQEADSPVYNIPQRNLHLHLSADEICQILDTWQSGHPLSFDIEGGVDAWPCCSVADAWSNGFIIAWSNFNEYDQGRIAVSLSRVLYRDDVPKVLQNSLYDRFVLAYKYQMLIRNVRDDTMVKHAEIYPESSTKDETTGKKRKAGFGKGLGVIASIWTREPYYKAEIKSDDRDTFYRYCIKDSCVTLEACQAMEQVMSDAAKAHYRFNVQLLDPLLYMELKGMHYDKALALEEQAKVHVAMQECGSRLLVRSGRDMTGKKGCISATKLKQVLYVDKGYPVQYNGRGRDKKVTTDINALLNLLQKFPSDPLLSDLLLHSKLESLAETLGIETDPDGRVRCAYNVVGTETVRITASGSPTGSGANLQTITKKLRKLYLADIGMEMGQWDLSGADGWTVAAHCLRHGDPTMWEDYHYGLKPAKIIALMYEHGADIARCSRDELKDRTELVDEDGWLYFGCKRVQHSTNYGVKARTGCAQLLQDSYKKTGTPIPMAVATYEALQRFYFLRYSGLYTWHRWAANEVMQGHDSISASGHTRTYFGRRRSWNRFKRTWEADHDTWKEFLANEPQENTTYATNLALHKLWYSPANRFPDGSLFVRPVHQVHDALIAQYPISARAQAHKIVENAFANKLRIADAEVTIPFSGNYGRSWGELDGKITCSL